jgi:hypothetical protein
MGMKIKFKKETELVFGDYADVYDGTDNMSCSHMIPCIAFFPCGNSTTKAIVDIINGFDTVPLLLLLEQEEENQHEQPAT